MNFAAKAKKKYPLKNKKRFLKKLFFLCIVIASFFTQYVAVNNPVFAESIQKNIERKYIDTVASSVIVEDYNSGRVLWEKNSEELIYPASITKIMTAIIVLEKVDDLNKVVTISENASGYNFSNIFFKINDRITVGDLLKAALVVSNNNATIALAEFVSGSEKEFVKLMNQKAKELGAFNTNFENTNGLDSDNPGHRTTAKDLIKIARYCMENPAFRELVALKEADIYINGKKISIQNTNILLDNDYIRGIKTGYTNNAGFCLLTYSNKNDIELLSVVLNSSPYGKNFDTLRLLGWIYDNYEYREIVSSKDALTSASAKNDFTRVNFDLYPEKDVKVLFNKNEDRTVFNFNIQKNINFPVIKNKPYGSVEVRLNDTGIENLLLYSRQDIVSPEINTEYLNSNSLTFIRWLLIFILAFYFLVLTFIIIKNLASLKTY